MNIRQSFKFCKRYFGFSDEELGEYLGISRPQVTKINGGYQDGLTISVLKRISQLLRISIDELVDNRFIPPSYHFSKHIYSVFLQCPNDYPEWAISKDDILYIRPYVYDPSKLGQFVIRVTANGFLLAKVTKDNSSEHFDFHVVGISRFLYKPIEDIDYQSSLTETSLALKSKRRGRPIKYD